MGFGARRILDFKVKGLPAFRLTSPFDVLNPLLGALTEVAEESMVEGEKLALLQLLVNYYSDGSKAVKAHCHRCRHICCSLGAPRDTEVEGVPTCMSHGDCLVLDRQNHSVPPTPTKTGARLSVCLFYVSAEQYAAGGDVVGVPAKTGPMWWSHPQDDLNKHIAATGQGKGWKLKAGN